MRAGIAVLIVVCAAAPADACPERDFDDLASGGPEVASYGDGPSKVVIRAVPSRPSLYFHRGEDERQPPPAAFTEEDGTPIAFTLVYTGIPEYPFRYDLAITAGTMLDPTSSRMRYEVAPGMTPHTRSVKASHWNGYHVVEIDSDAALLRFEHAGKTWLDSNWPPMTRYFETMDLRITALYADRTEEVIFDRRAPPKPSRGLERHALLSAIAMALLALVALLGFRGSAPGSPASRR